MVRGTLEIHDQPRLSVRRQVEICADGVRHRFFRSMTTLAVVTLAVAFLVNMLTESVVVSSCKRGVGAKREQQERLDRFLSLCNLSPEPVSVRKRLAETPVGSLAERVLPNWAGMDKSQFDAFGERCRQVELAQAWLDELRPAYRRMLLENCPLDEALSRLSEPARWKRFQKELKEATAIRMPSGFSQVVESYGAFEAELAEVSGRIKVAVEKLKSDLDGKALRDALDDWGSKDAWSGSAAKFLSDHGISLTKEEFASLAADARVQKQADVLQWAVTRPEINQAWLKKYSKNPTLNDAFEALASKSAKGKWLTERIRDKVEASGLPASELPGLAQRLRYVQSTEAAQNQLMAEYGRGEGIGANAVWLIAVSLLVCVVGISNAMLISVLERFREIATMKCLGALNGLIATLFLLEAAFLGTVGGVAGVVIGAVLGLARMFVGYGAWVAAFFPYLGMLGVAGASILIGMLLTTLAAIYPAFRAAKMPPMEAMRVE